MRPKTPTRNFRAKAVTRIAPKIIPDKRESLRLKTLRLESRA